MTMPQCPAPSAPCLQDYPEVLEDLWSKIGELFAAKGMPRATADEAAFAITEYIRAEWSGRNRYTPKAKAKAAPGQDGLFAEPPAEQEDASPEHMRQLRGQVMTILGDLGVSGAVVWSGHVADLVRDEWAGEKVYIPKGITFDLNRRDYAIWRDWDGSYGSKLRLLQQHGITEQRFYQIVAAVRRREFKRTQPMLPGMDEAISGI